jgi:Zn finger protein HypA/HybF involved in hydrogenase expression
MPKVKCKFCQYEWDTKSNHVFVSCPSCMHKINITQSVVEKEKE